MLTSKVALITGAAQGIGLAAARLLLKNGGRVRRDYKLLVFGQIQIKNGQKFISW